MCGARQSRSWQAVWHVRPSAFELLHRDRHVEPLEEGSGLVKPIADTTDNNRPCRSRFGDFLCAISIGAETKRRGVVVQ